MNNKYDKKLLERCKRLIVEYLIDKEESTEGYMASSLLIIQISVVEKLDIESVSLDAVVTHTYDLVARAVKELVKEGIIEQPHYNRGKMYRLTTLI